MKILFAFISFGMSFSILLWGIYVWWMEKRSRQNRAFMGVAVSIVLWSGSLAVLTVCPPEQSPYYGAISIWGAVLSSVFIFLFLLTFYEKGKVYRILSIVGPTIATIICALRYYLDANIMVPTKYGIFPMDRICPINFVFYGYILLICISASCILLRHRKEARLHRDRICLGYWLILIGVFFTILIAGAFINMIFQRPTSPYEGFVGNIGAIVFYMIADYADVIVMPSKRLNEYITEHLTTPLVFVDSNKRVTYCNEAFKELFGITGDAYGKDCFFPNIITERTVEDAINYVIEEEMEEGSFMATTLDGKHILNIRFVILFDRFGEAKAIIYIINDVTHTQELLKRLETETAYAQQQAAIAAQQTALAEEQTRLAEKNREAAVRASEAKSGFLANMSHEIRTPLNAIIGMNEMVMREEISPAAQKYSQDIYNAGQTLLAIINDILDFSKIESGKMEIVPVTYELSSVLNDVINMVAKKVSDKGLELSTNVMPDIPYKLFGDEVRIRQVMLNILSNAVKYTPEGSIVLRVEWNRLDDVRIELHISISDTGVGIREEDVKKLFQGFQRVDMEHNRTIEGTGLGLAITKRLVEQMEGTISVESEYGKGSTFTITLPQVVMNDTPMGDFTKAYQKMRRGREESETLFMAPDARILVVDDNRVNLTVARGLIKKSKIQVDIAQSGKIALEMIKTNHYHIIFLDHMMPEMNGIETIKRMKAQEENASRDAVVIALTANAISGSREMYMAAGFDDYLSKPIDVVRYTDLIRKYLPEELIHA